MDVESDILGVNVLAVAETVLVLTLGWDRDLEVSVGRRLLDGDDVVVGAVQDEVTVQLGVGLWVSVTVLVGDGQLVALVQVLEETSTAVGGQQDVVGLCA